MSGLSFYTTVDSTGKSWYDELDSDNMYRVPALWIRKLKEMNEKDQQYSVAMDGVVAQRKLHPELFDENDDRYYETCEGNRYFKEVFKYKDSDYVCLYYFHNERGLTEEEQYVVLSEYPGEEEWTERHIEVCLYGSHL